MMRMQPKHEGWIEVVCGPMFSGKSDELIRRVDRAQIAGQCVHVFKPALDDRYHATAVASHAGARFDASLIEDEGQFIEKVLELAQTGAADVVAVDEVQFLSDSIVEAVEILADSGVRVIVAGLDQDFLRRPFGPMPELLVRAEFVDKLQAVCMGCQGPASHTQRLMPDGQPAKSTDPLVLVGATDSYEARCRSCHEIG